jgi:hypothetical protein
MMKTLHNILTALLLVQFVVAHAVVNQDFPVRGDSSRTFLSSSHVNGLTGKFTTSNNKSESEAWSKPADANANFKIKNTPAHPVLSILTFSPQSLSSGYSNARHLRL